MKKLLCIILLLFTLGCAPKIQQVVDISTQQKCDAPVWNAGDSWRFRYANMREGQISVERVEGNLYVVKDHNSMETYYFDKRTLNYQYSMSPQGKKFRNENIFFYGIYCDFPIFVGKKWAKMVSGQYPVY
jgi:hypothetical protein